MFLESGGLVFLAHAAQPLLDRPPVVLVNQVTERTANELFGPGGTQQFDPGGIDENEAVLDLDEERIGRQNHKRSIALFAREKGLLSLPPVMWALRPTQGPKNRPGQRGGC